MNSMQANVLGPLQARIYWLHDAEDFEQLAAAASKMYQLLGYSESLANQAGMFISEAYQISDKAETARYASDEATELMCYAEAKMRLEAAAKLLNIPIEVAECQVQWWMHFRHKRFLKASWHIFRQHYQPSDFARIVGAIKISYLLLRAGLSHNQRDLEKCGDNAIRYWETLLKLRLDRYPYVG